MVRLYITLDEFANRQVEGIDTIFWLHGGRSFRQRAPSAMGGGDYGLRATTMRR